MVAVSLTAPFLDVGGVLQPSYLNANVTLMREPTRDLQVSTAYSASFKSSLNS
jgi:hypothetical protein